MRRRPATCLLVAALGLAAPAGISGGRVIDGGQAMHCETGVLERASLGVMATGSNRPFWGITDPVARVLGACQRPVLFIPAQ